MLPVFRHQQRCWGLNQQNKVKPPSKVDIFDVWCHGSRRLADASDVNEASAAPVTGSRTDVLISIQIAGRGHGSSEQICEYVNMWTYKDDYFAVFCPETAPQWSRSNDKEHDTTHSTVYAAITISSRVLQRPPVCQAMFNVHGEERGAQTEKREAHAGICLW